MFVFYTMFSLFKFYQHLTLFPAGKSIRIIHMAKLTISDTIIAMLCSSRSTKTFYKILREREIKKHNESSVKMAFSRLQKRNLIVNKNDLWGLTKKGAEYYKKRKSIFSFIDSPFHETSPKSMIIAFDIPEADRHKRLWLRNQLKIFRYTKLQQSLWIGPGPLPESFYGMLKGLGIREHIKTFSIKPK